MRARSFVTVLLAASVVAACSGDDGQSAEPTSSSTTERVCDARTDQTDLAYLSDGDPLQVLDLYQPPGVDPCEAVPLVVWVHGGGWQVGDKANGMDSKVELWTSKGWAVASIGYRLTDPELPPDQRLMAPAHNEDVAAALAWLGEHAADLGIDPGRVALLGHSAGAGIVAALASDPAYLEAVGLEPTDLDCVAPLDTEGFDVATAATGGGPLEQLYLTVFGSDPDAWAKLSPITHLGEASVPDLFLVTRGTATRRAAVETFVDAAQAAAATVTVVDLPTFSHADVNRRIGDPTDDQLTPELQAFLESCLA